MGHEKSTVRLIILLVLLLIVAGAGAFLLFRTQIGGVSLKKDASNTSTKSSSKLSTQTPSPATVTPIPDSTVDSTWASEYCYNTNKGESPLQQQKSLGLDEKSRKMSSLTSMSSNTAEVDLVAIANCLRGKSFSVTVEGSATDKKITAKKGETEYYTVFGKDDGKNKIVRILHLP